MSMSISLELAENEATRPDASASPQEIIDWAVEKFGMNLVMSSSFGAASAAFIHLVTRRLPEIRIVFVDTGYLFPETFAFMEQLRNCLHLNVWTYRTRNDPIRYLIQSDEADPDTRRDVEGCCAANKNEPFERAMRELGPKAWFRGIRRDQAASRERRNVVEWSNRYACYAISPILDWSQRQVHDYMGEHDLPFHPLYHEGYSSIGCNPRCCTRPIGIGEGLRAGRWADLPKTECGLHL